MYWTDLYTQWTRERTTSEQLELRDSHTIACQVTSSALRLCTVWHTSLPETLVPTYQTAQCHTAHDNILIIQPATQRQRNEADTIYVRMTTHLLSSYNQRSICWVLVRDIGASLPARPKLYDAILRHTLLIRPPSGVKLCDATNNTRWGTAKCRLVILSSNKPPNGQRKKTKTDKNFTPSMSLNPS